LEADGRRVVAVREPGGTPVGDRVRAILLDADLTDMTDEAEMLLFAASRAQLVRQVLKPELEAGAVVLCDRYVYSSLAYQGHARGLGRDFVAGANAPAVDGLLPDRVVLVDLPVETALARARARATLDRIEAEDRSFHTAVRAGFLQEAANDEARFLIVDGSGTPEDVHRAVVEGLGL
jgi:dTMP kinase